MPPESMLQPFARLNYHIQSLSPPTFPLSNLLTHTHTHLRAFQVALLMHKLAASTTIIINYTLKLDITFYCGSTKVLLKPHPSGRGGGEREELTF